MAERVKEKRRRMGGRTSARERDRENEEERHRHGREGVYDGTDRCWRNSDDRTIEP